ncbi:T9SS C-terminal target domain-containing protein, partial [Chryseobacterium sp. SIMBA_028]
ENKMIPYVKTTPAAITEEAIVQSENNGVLTLKINRDELSAVNIFDGNKNVVKTVSKEQYDKDGGIAIKDLENQPYTFEIVTEFYNLQ